MNFNDQKKKETLIPFSDVLNELDRRVLVGEIPSEIRAKILKEINKKNQR